MKRIEVALITGTWIALVGHVASGVQSGDIVPPQITRAIGWAFGYGASLSGVPAGQEPAPYQGVDPETLLHIPGSRVATKASTFDRQFKDDGIKAVADWYPDEHGPMPAIVQFGRRLFKSDGAWDGQEGIRACGHCHLATGTGRPENAQPGGLPLAYLLQQMEDFRNGLRASPDPNKENMHRMVAYAKLLTPEEDRASAEYFSAQRFPKIITVIESPTAPKSYMVAWMFHALRGPGAGHEPLRNRIVEIPEDEARNALRDQKSGYLAFVPVGSLKRGQAVALKGKCADCHGPNLQGTTEVPALAGRSPSYMARQLFDMQTGARRGPMAAGMKPILANMSADDMLNVVAYAASIPPSGNRSN